MANIETLRFWIRIVTVIAAIATTSFPVIYSFSNWRSHSLGRLLMYMGISFATALDLTVIFTYWRPPLLFMFWMDALFLTAIAITTSSLTYWVWKMNFSKKRK